MQQEKEISANNNQEKTEKPKIDWPVRYTDTKAQNPPQPTQRQHSSTKAIKAGKHKRHGSDPIHISISKMHPCTNKYPSSKKNQSYTQEMTKWAEWRRGRRSTTLGGACVLLPSCSYPPIPRCDRMSNSDAAAFVRKKWIKRNGEIQLHSTQCYCRDTWFGSTDFQRVKSRFFNFMLVDRLRTSDGRRPSALLMRFPNISFMKRLGPTYSICNVLEPGARLILTVRLMW